MKVVVAVPVALKLLLQEQHLHAYPDFVAEYKKHAAALCNPGDTASPPPSRSQYFKWLNGTVNRMPRAHHCRVLESMFPGWTAGKLLAQADSIDNPRLQRGAPHQFGTGRLADAVANALLTRDASLTGWGLPKLPAAQPPARSATVQFDHPDLPAHTRQIGKRLAALAQVLRLDETEIVQMAGLIGNVVELEHRIILTIDANGSAHLAYTHEMFNMSEAPLTRIPRQLWFEYTQPGGLHIEPLRRGQHEVAIERTHDAGSLAKFVCQVSPAIQPGETGTVGYTCTGGRFVTSHYWHQDIGRYTRRFSIDVRQAGCRLVSCSGEEVVPSGNKHGAAESLLWDHDDNGIAITLTRDHLRPNQSVTVRWEIMRDEAVA
ncbi:hypothetical protein [Nocardia asiatica]|uniref:hypothetical protein n=1 Tax=Nocardia asiatica TaxID=209252 RepID=UPI0006884771|nr:hypothetical protein [Nocardia asiatica]